MRTTKFRSGSYRIVIDGFRFRVDRLGTKWTVWILGDGPYPTKRPETPEPAAYAREATAGAPYPGRFTTKRNAILAARVLAKRWADSIDNPAPPRT